MKNILTTYPLGGNAITGMTKQQAGNFSLSQPETCQGLVFASEVFSLLRGEHTSISRKRVFVMDARDHTGKVPFWNLEKSLHAQRVCDGVIWSHEGIALCFPGGCPVLTFVNEKTGLLGMLHCSCKTIGQRIITNFATQWQFFGGCPENTSIRFLPAICGHCLTFDQPYWEKKVSPALRWTGQEPQYFIVARDDLIGLDLFRLSAAILAKCGYTRIETDGVCTSCSNEYWDYRHHDSKESGGQKYRNAAFLYAESLPHLA